MTSGTRTAPVRARRMRVASWIEERKRLGLSTAVVRVLSTTTTRKSRVRRLLDYLPAADSDAVLKKEVANALTALAYVEGKPHGRCPGRGARGCACRCGGPSPAGPCVDGATSRTRSPWCGPSSAIPRPGVRLRAALALLAANDARAPFLSSSICLAELLSGPSTLAEEALQKLAGTWAPATTIKGEDDIARRIRRDSWAAWWRNTDGPALLAEFRRRTLTPAEHERTLGLIEKLSDERFEVRQRASDDLVASGTRVIPVLRAAIRHTDAERAHRAAQCLKRITEEGRPLPTSAAHLLALRKPDVALEVLLDYLPFAEEESSAEEVQHLVAACYMRVGDPDPASCCGRLGGQVSAAACGLRRGAPEGQTRSAALRRCGKLLGDADPLVRLTVGSDPGDTARQRRAFILGADRGPCGGAVGKPGAGLGTRTGAPGRGEAARVRAGAR